MAQDQDSTNPSNRYGHVGEEVASVLASARSASVEVRNQAISYAESLVASARDEISELRREADTEAYRTLTSAEARARTILQDARRNALAVIEMAHTRVLDAEAAEKAAHARYEVLMGAENELIDRIANTARSAIERIEELRSQQRGLEPGDSHTPVQQVEGMLASSTAELIADSGTPANHLEQTSRGGNGHGQLNRGSSDN